MREGLRVPDGAIPPRVRLPLAVEAAALRADLEGIAPHEWTPHFNRAVYEGDWSGVALRSLGGDPSRLYPDPTRQARFDDTPLLARCPGVRAFLALLPCPFTSVRFLRLGAGARIREHHDSGLGVEDGEVRLHAPVTSSPEVDFFLGGVRVPMEPGELWYLNVNRPHRVENRGASARVHLVVDATVNEWLLAGLRAGEPL